MDGCSLVPCSKLEERRELLNISMAFKSKKDCTNSSPLKCWGRKSIFYCSQEQTSFRPNLSLDTILPRLLTVKLASHKPCFKIEPAEEVVRRAGKVTWEYMYVLLIIFWQSTLPQHDHYICTARTIHEYK